MHVTKSDDITLPAVCQFCWIRSKKIWSTMDTITLVHYYVHSELEKVYIDQKIPSSNSDICSGDKIRYNDVKFCGEITWIQICSNVQKLLVSQSVFFKFFGEMIQHYGKVEVVPKASRIIFYSYKGQWWRDVGVKLTAEQLTQFIFLLLVLTDGLIKWYIEMMLNDRLSVGLRIVAKWTQAAIV